VVFPDVVTYHFFLQLKYSRRAMARRRITIVCSHFKPHWGGIERFADIQSRMFESLGYQVSVITHDTERCGFLESTGNITIYRLRCISFMKGARIPVPVSLGQLLTVYRNCFREPSALTVVHARYYFLSIIGCLLAWYSGKRAIVIDHSSSHIEVGGRLTRMISRLYENLMTFCIKIFRPRFYGVAEACVAWLKHFSIQADGVYYNGLETGAMRESVCDIRARHDLSAGTRIVLSVGRLVREKGVGELLDAFESFSQTHSDYVLIVIGYGELEERVSLAAQRNSKILFLGKQPPEVVWSYMKEADIFVNPSNYPEGMPTILLEAGYYGLTVISTSNGGAAELVVHNHTGVTIPRGAAKEILDALVSIDANFSACRTLGDKLQQLVLSKFCFAKITKQFLVENITIED
jgi:glycosyltransferase involved in cell wall biosynthesis